MNSDKTKCNLNILVIGGSSFGKSRYVTSDASSAVTSSTSPTTATEPDDTDDTGFTPVTYDDTFDVSTDTPVIPDEAPASTEAENKGGSGKKKKTRTLLRKKIGSIFTAIGERDAGRRKGFIVAEVIAGVIFIAAVALFVWLKVANPLVDTTARQISENIDIETDETFLPMLTFQLYGKYTATDKKSKTTSTEYTFEFKADEKFFGFTEEANDDIGVYGIYSDGKKYYLDIKHTGGTDTYKITFYADNKVTLVNDRHEFTLTLK